MNISKLLLALAVFISWSAHADIILSTPHAQVVSGTPLQLELTVTNSDPQPLVVELPDKLHVRFETPTGLSVIEMTPERTGRIEVGFRRLHASEVGWRVAGKRRRCRDPGADRGWRRTRSLLHISSARDHHRCDHGQ